MIEQEIFELLKKQKWTVSFAESCTGGMLSSCFVALPGVSAVFKGAMISYSNDIKMKHLGVSRELLQTKGPFNEETALQMAKGVRSQMQTDWAVSTTGIAGPNSIENDPAVGTVCFAVVGLHQFHRSFREVFSGSREDVRRQAVSKAFFLLKDSVESLLHS